MINVSGPLRSGSCFLNLSLNLNLATSLAEFFSILLDKR